MGIDPAERESHAVSTQSGSRLILENRSSRFPVSVLLRALAVVVLWAPLPVALGAAAVYGAYQDVLPITPQILEPPPGSATRLVTLVGSPVGGLQRGLAPWASYGDIPPRLVEAFLAAEDDEFFLHQGVDFQAIVRAAFVNLRAGVIRQGGSTITQQVAKMFVGASRSYERKLVELMLARRIEAAYSKEEILECYLNRIYLGAGAYGVVAAARIYFDRTLEGLTVAEAATLAGIASAPTAFEPYDNPERARARRDYVLGRMAALGFISEGVAEDSRAEPVVLRERGEVPERPLPYADDAIRAELTAEYGRDVWRYGALTVQTGLSVVQQRYAEDALLAGVGAIDRRQGYRGPLGHVEGLVPSDFDEIVSTHISAGQPTRPALVTAVSDSTLTVWVDGESVSLGRDSWSWAAPYDPQSSENGQEREVLDGLAVPGDVVLVERMGEGHNEPGGLRLTQIPRLEGALVAVDLDTGYVLAMAGGVDYDRSQFNRVTRGCRQPGSVFKPVIYSAALDRNWTLASLLLDAPLQLVQGVNEIWRPRNADADFRGVISLRTALILSRNLPTVRLFRSLGARAVVRRASELGFTTPMDPTDALSLGASCVYPIDATTAFGVFALGGYRQRPILIVSVVDGRGHLVADNGVFYDGAASTSAILNRAFTDLEEVDRPVIDPRTAFLMRHVLSDVVRLGTGHPATALGVPVAGKTGTTTAFDAWFVGFTESLATAVWVGSDRNTRSLGGGETGAEVALPIWVAFMSDALGGRQQGSLVDDVPAGIRFVKIDLATGLLAREDAPGAWLPFREGTEPVEYAPTPEQVDLVRLDRVDDRF